MATGRPLSAKLFLEGIEVPFTGATITTTVGQAGIAYIDVVPHATINNIKPRTMAHIFVRDVNNEKEGFPYVLAFEGEVFGYSFNKTPSGRSMSLSCIDFSSYWDNVVTYFFNAQQTMGKSAEEIQVSGLDQADARKSQTKIIPVTNARSSYFIQVINKVLSKPGTDFLDGFVGVIKDISSTNSFYQLASKRLRIEDRIVLHSSKSLSKLLRQQEAIEWFSSVIGRTTGYQTLRNVILDLLGLIYHDTTSIPFPAVVDSKISGATLTKNGKPKDTIGEFVFKPNLFMMPPPICNTFFPDEYSSFTFSRNFLQEPTRLIYKPEVPVFGGSSVAMIHKYEPESFSNFMAPNKNLTNLSGEGDVQVPPAYKAVKFGDPEAKFPQTGLGKKREQHFLTNEELMKGILMAQEGMVPAASQFRSAMSEIGKNNYLQGIAKYLFYKKRYQGRQLEITSHLKLSVVPGFPVLIVDDSDASQTVVAYCNSVTHRIYATQGGYTNTSLSYARTVEEQDASSGKANEPLIPPWFAEEIFGSRGVPKASPAAKGTRKKQEQKAAKAGSQNIIPDAISKFYATLLGKSGSDCITTNTKTSTLLAASLVLVEDYKKQRQIGPQAVHSFIDQKTRRRYVTMKEAFGFLGATTNAEDLSLPFLEFSGAGILGSGEDKTPISKKRAVVLAYRDALKKNRGFRG
ncbi:MAG: hypothetical protein EBZ49_00765 [Proteobacteria bacterium]|nr:hypothetical protein [Pseudomonadota bacterium]